MTATGDFRRACRVGKPIEPVFAELQIGEQLALPAPTVMARSDGMIGIELPSGSRVSVDATVNADALSRVPAKDIRHPLRSQRQRKFRSDD